jgi:hypothetical protein
MAVVTSSPIVKKTMNGIDIELSWLYCGSDLIIIKLVRPPIFVNYMQQKSKKRLIMIMSSVDWCHAGLQLKTNVVFQQLT